MSVPFSVIVTPISNSPFVSCTRPETFVGAANEGRYTNNAIISISPFNDFRILIFIITINLGQSIFRVSYPENSILTKNPRMSGTPECTGQSFFICLYITVSNVSCGAVNAVAHLSVHNLNSLRTAVLNYLDDIYALARQRYVSRSGTCCHRGDVLSCKRSYCHVCLCAESGNDKNVS